MNEQIQTKQIQIVNINPRPINKFNSDGTQMVVYEVQANDGIKYTTFDRNWIQLRKIGEIIAIQFQVRTTSGSNGRVFTNYNIVIPKQQMTSGFTKPQPQFGQVTPRNSLSVHPNLLPPSQPGNGNKEVLDALRKVYERMIQSESKLSQDIENLKLHFALLIPKENKINEEIPSVQLDENYIENEVKEDVVATDEGKVDELPPDGLPF